MWTYLLFIIISYILGSIPSGLIVGKLFYDTDIREHGSGNLGGTNAFRVLGKKAGMVVTTTDILKGTLSVLLPVIFNQPDINPLTLALFVVIGHMFPIFAKFRGGKAVATSGGVVLGLSPLIFFIVLMTFFIVLYLFKYVSLSSMITGVVAVIISIILRDVNLIILTSVFTVVIFYRHKSNIKRIMNKTEPKITWL